MARKSDGTVYIDTLVDTQGFGKGVNTMQKQIGGLGGAVKKLGLAIAATFAVGNLIKFGKEAIDLGSDLQEVQNVVDVTFTSMSDQVNEFARGAAEAAGLSETMAKRYVGTFGAMAKAFGFAESEAFNMSTSLTQLAGDVASFYNMTQDEAYTKLKSVFTGETESLKDLGVVMTQTALDSFAMAKGYGKTTKAMTEQEKVALRYAFVMDQLSAASGDFVRTSDSWANQTRILSLNFDSFKANIGQALINIFTPFLKVINQIVAKMAQLSQHFVAFSELLVGKSTSGGGGSPGDTLAKIESGYEDIADATNEATKAQKNYVAGLDEIRTLAEEKESISDIGGIPVTDIDSDIVDATNDTLESIEELEKKYPKVIGFVRNSIQLIKSAFNNMLEGDLFGFGQDVSALAIAFYNFFTEIIQLVDWKTIGDLIGDYLAGVDWLGIIKAALTLKINIWEVMAEAWVGAFEAAPFETAVITGIAALKWTGLGSALLSGMLKSLTGGLSLAGLGTKIVGFFKGFFSTAGLLSSPGMVGELGIQIERLLEGTFLDPNTWDGWLGDAWDGFNKGVEDFFNHIFDGIENSIIGLIAGFYPDKSLGIFEVSAQWFDKLSDDFNKQDWLAIGEDIVKGIGNGIWGALTFLVEPIVDLLSYTFEETKKELGKRLDDTINFINGKMSKINISLAGGGISIGAGAGASIARLNVPMLASGTVIPPNAPFAAILGDQKHGTNIEAPLDTIKQAVREVVGSGTGGQYQFTAQINRRTLFDEIVAEAKLQKSTTGRNPFELA